MLPDGEQYKSTEVLMQVSIRGCTPSCSIVCQELSVQLCLYVGGSKALGTAYDFVILTKYRRGG